MKKEIDVLRQEKMSYHKKIGDLLDKLEESVKIHYLLCRSIYALYKIKYVT